MLEGGHGPNIPDDIVLHRNRAGSLTGVIYFGSQLVLAADDDATVDAFAIETRRHAGLRSFVGPAARVARLWENVASWHRPPILARTHQPVYLLLRRASSGSPDVGVRRATLDDAESVIENSAEMMLGELGYDPRSNRVSFGAGVRRAIAGGQWWVWIAGDEFRFQLNVGARTPLTAQLQGVWTPPSMRRRGYAALALAEISRLLLAENPTLSLYVNDFNTGAIALYERVGFIRVGAMSTLLFA